MSLTSVWAKWEKWNSAFRTWFPHVKFCSPHGDQVKWYWKGSLRMSAVLPRQNAFGSRKRGGWNRNGELADGQGLLAARARLNAVTQWHCRWEYPWVQHGETAGTGGNENMKGVGIVWVGTRDVYASDVGHMTHEDPWSLNPLPNHHKPPANRPTIEHRWTTNLIESAELIRREHIRLSDYARTEQNRNVYFLRLTIFSTTWPKGHRWARTE